MLGLCFCSIHIFMSVNNGIENVFAAVFFSILLAILSGPGDFPFLRLLVLMTSSLEINSSVTDKLRLLLYVLCTFVLLL